MSAAAQTEPTGRTGAERRALRTLLRPLVLSRRAVDLDAALFRHCLATHPRLIMAVSHGGAISSLPIGLALLEATAASFPNRRIVATMHPGFWKVPVLRRLMKRFVGTEEHLSIAGLRKAFEADGVFDYYAFPESEFSLYGDLEEIKPFRFHGFIELSVRSQIPLLLVVHRGSEGWYQPVPIGERGLQLIDRLPARLFEAVEFSKHNVIEDLRTYGQLNVPVPLSRLPRLQVELEIYLPALRALSPGFAERQRQLRGEGERIRERMQLMYDRLTGFRESVRPASPAGAAS